jgi:hypothetical protein
MALCSQAVAASMAEQKPGAITNVLSMAARNGGQARPDQFDQVDGKRAGAARRDRQTPELNGGQPTMLVALLGKVDKMSTFHGDGHRVRGCASDGDHDRYSAAFRRRRGYKRVHLVFANRARSQAREQHSGWRAADGHSGSCGSVVATEAGGPVTRDHRYQPDDRVQS